MMLAATSDLVCLTSPTVSVTGAAAALGLRTFPIPLDIPRLEIGMAWHPRHDTDVAHRWFREHVRAIITQQT
jgi:DNA-binding transcriptional LysR family regulator